jgi:glycosyltransferase involved in cell wall biosynthesis
MKICYLANAASTHTQRWAKAMRDKGCIIDVISFDRYDIEGVNVHYVKPLKSEYGKLPSEPKNKSYILKCGEVKKIIKAAGPDILHAHYATGYGLTGALLGFHPYVISTWGTDIFNAPKRNALFKSMVKYNLKKADYITSTSMALTKETMLYTDKKVYTIPFGIDLKSFCPQKGKANNNSNIVIGMVKSLEEVYGIRYGIQAFYELHKKYRNTELLIVGSGTQKDEMVKLCNDLNISHDVRFIGRVPNGKVPEYLNMMDIFLMPSLNESFGVAALEAEACGLPVVASDAGGIPEVVAGGKTGFLVKPKDIHSIADALEKLVVDVSLRENMGEAGRKFVSKNYNWSDNVKSMYNLYVDILK